MTDGFEPDLHLVSSYRKAVEFVDWISQHHDVLGCDTETGGLDWWRDDLRTVQFGDRNTGWTIPYQEWGGLVHDALERHSGPLVFHNAKFDLHTMENHGYKVGRHRVHDTLILARLFDNTARYGLKYLASHNIDGRIELLERDMHAGFKNHGWTWASVPVEFSLYWQYAALDPVITVRMWEHFSEVYEKFPEIYDLELTCQQVLVDMERRGLGLDLEYVQHALVGLESEQEDLIERLNDFGIRRPGSNESIINKLLLDGVQLTKRTDKGNYQLSEEVLSAIEHPIAKLVLDYRNVTKISNTYLKKFVEFEHNGRIHPSINQLRVVTGRMSIERPSMQNLHRSKLVRDSFVPAPDHKLVLIDYDQIEYRLMADYAGLEEIKAAAIAGEDLHTTTAKMVYGVETPTKDQRQLTKNATFAKIYGAGIEKFAETAGISGKQAAEFMKAYDLANPQVAVFSNKLIAQAELNGGFIETAYGRRLYHEDTKGAYVLVNYLIQGTAADVLKAKIVELSLMGLDKYLLLPVHDELIFEVPIDGLDEYVVSVKEVMEERQKFSVPLTVGVDVVDSWGENYE